MVVCGFGAGGSEGKASWLEEPPPPPPVRLAPELAGGARAADVTAAPSQLGCEAREGPEDPDGPGRAGNADVDGEEAEGRLCAQSDELAVLAAPVEMILPMLALRVLFLSFNTLVEFLACAAALAALL